jgi:restriction system protein
MARRSSVFEDLMALSARLPWGVGLALALVSFLLFHGLSVYFSIPVTAKSVADIGTVAQRGLFGTVASLLQFVVPAAFVVGAGVSCVKRGRARVSFDRVASHGVSTVSRLSWRDFEALIGEGFRRQDIR